MEIYLLPELLTYAGIELFRVVTSFTVTGVVLWSLNLMVVIASDGLYISDYELNFQPLMELRVYTGKFQHC
jgi:hypothetical protein